MASGVIGWIPESLGQSDLVETVLDEKLGRVSGFSVCQSQRCDLVDFSYFYGTYFPRSDADGHNIIY